MVLSCGTAQDKLASANKKAEHALSEIFIAYCGKAKYGPPKLRLD
jgi:hypothetical protein